MGQYSTGFLSILLAAPCHTSGNRSSPCSISMTSSTRFRLAELTAFAEISESTFVFPIFLYVTLLPSFIFMSLILSITILYRIVPFRVLDRYSTSLLPSCCFALIIFTFISGRINQQFAQSPFALIQFIEDLSYQRSVETWFQHRLGRLALHYCPKVLHESKSVHVTACSVFMIPVLRCPLFI